MAGASGDKQQADSGRGAMLLDRVPGQMHLETQAYWLSHFLLHRFVCFSGPGLSVCGGFRQTLHAMW